MGKKQRNKQRDVKDIIGEKLETTILEHKNKRIIEMKLMKLKNDLASQNFSSYMIKTKTYSRNKQLKRIFFNIFDIGSNDIKFFNNVGLVFTDQKSKQIERLAQALRIKDLFKQKKAKNKSVQKISIEFQSRKARKNMKLRLINSEKRILLRS